MQEPFDWNPHRMIVLNALREAKASYAVIASFVGCSPGTVKAKLHRMRIGVQPRVQKRRLRRPVARDNIEAGRLENV